MDLRNNLTHLVFYLLLIFLAPGGCSPPPINETVNTKSKLNLKECLSAYYSPDFQLIKAQVRGRDLVLKIAKKDYLYRWSPLSPCQKELQSVEISPFYQIDSEKELSENVPLSPWICDQGECETILTPHPQMHKAYYLKLKGFLIFSEVKIPHNFYISLVPYSYYRQKTYTAYLGRKLPFTIDPGKDYSLLSTSVHSQKLEIISVKGGSVHFVSQGIDRWSGKFHGEFIPEKGFGNQKAVITYQLVDYYEGNLSQAIGHIVINVKDQNSPLETFVGEEIVNSPEDTFTLTFLPGHHFRDEEGDLPHKLFIKSIRGGQVEVWNCSSQGTCSINVTFYEDSSQINFNYALIDQWGVISNFSHFSIKRM